MAIKFLQLNIETDKHFERIIPFLEKENFDVICFQEIYEDDAKMLAEKFNLHLFLGKEVLCKGDSKAIFSKYPFVKTMEHHLWQGDHRYHLKNESFSLLEVCILHEGKEYTFFTTHLPVSYPGNIIVEYQLECYKALKPILEKEQNLLFTGDLNSPRGTFIFDDLANFLVDHIPLDLESSLDPNLHKTRGEVKYVVDGVFSKGDHKVSGISIHEGLSDHKAISGILE